MSLTYEPPAETGFVCPYCGEEGGEPRTVYSREFQGEEGHGGYVEWADEACSLCHCDGPDPMTAYKQKVEEEI
jgi:hypothetical protein